MSENTKINDKQENKSISNHGLIRFMTVMLSIAAFIYILEKIYTPIISPIIQVAQPFIIAFVFAFLLDPFVDWLERRNLTRGMGVLIVGCIFIVVVLSIGFFVIPKVIDQASGLANNAESFINNAEHQIDHIMAKHQKLLVKLNLPVSIKDISSQYSDQISEIAQSSLSGFTTTLGSLFGRILWIIIIPLSSLWLLKDLDYLKLKILYFCPTKHKQKLSNLGSSVGVVFGKYVRGMITVSIIYSVVSCIWMSFFGLNYALIIGAVSGLLYLVPYIGVLTAMLIAGITMLVQTSGDLGHSAILMGILAFQSFIVFDLGITPRVVGGSVGIHPVLTLIALALGAKFFGVAGMVFAVPVAAAIQVAIGQFYPKINDRLTPQKVKQSFQDKSA